MDNNPSLRSDTHPQLSFLLLRLQRQPFNSIAQSLLFASQLLQSQRLPAALSTHADAAPFSSITASGTTH